jgi:hypothetical protein
MINNRDKESFADFITNRFDPNFEYTSKEKEIEGRDFRIDKPKTSDMVSRYSEFKDFEQSDSFRNTQIAANLLSNKFDIESSHLSNVLKQKYHLSNSECNEVLKNLGNHKNVEVSGGLFYKDYKLRKRGK